MKIVVATDGSSHSDGAISLLCRLPLRDPKVKLLTVINPIQPVFGADYPLIADEVYRSFDNVQSQLRKSARLLLDRQEKRLRACGLQAQKVVAEGHIADRIIRTCDESKADLLVVGSRGLGGFKGMLLGSVSQQLVRHAPCSLLIVRTGAARPKSGARKPGTRSKRLRLLLASDGSTDALSAANLLARLPLHRGIEVTLFTAMPAMASYGLNRAAIQLLTEVWEEDRRMTEEGTEKAARRIGSAGARVTTRAATGQPGREILKAASAIHADIIMLGARGKSAIDRFLMGSVSSFVTIHARDSAVWVIRSRAR